MHELNPKLRAFILHYIIAALTSLRNRINSALYGLHRAEQDANFEARCIEDEEPTL